jgi:UDP-N-acetylglucosamine acyltransferase
VIPYGSVIGDRARLAGLNLVGLKRRGVERDTIHAVRGCYRAIFHAAEGSLAERAAAARAEHADVPAALEIIDFILADSARSFCTPEE